MNLLGGGGGIPPPVPRSPHPVASSLSLSFTQLDHCLQEDSAVYKSFRFKGSIGPMRVQLVGRGAFLELRSSLSALSPATFKMQRVLRSKECTDFLLRRTIS